jgi:hypothetical protein
MQRKHSGEDGFILRSYDAGYTPPSALMAQHQLLDLPNNALRSRAIQSKLNNSFYVKRVISSGSVRSFVPSLLLLAKVTTQNPTLATPIHSLMPD